jgi:DNA recombination protein RmuC
MADLLLYLLVFLAAAAVLLISIAMVRAKWRLDILEKNLDRMERFSREDMARNREEMRYSLRDFNESLLNRMDESAARSIQKLDRIDETVDLHLKTLQEDNSRRLEQIRATVDDRLQDTLERRLGESFKLVSDRLDMVHRGLGEMQTLASGVGDLKKVLTNIKTRGTLGEIRLQGLLEQILSPDQYQSNVATKRDSATRVEFAIRLPGRDAAENHPVWLPIDAKFPQEDYLRFLEAQESGNADRVDNASRQLERTIREMARNIRDKYLDPPYTTDFSIMFLPTEGLYAEVLRRGGLFELLQREFKVVVAGPTTLAALLNSLQMGFRTLAIEKRSSEVWTLLGTVKTEFSTFGAILDRTQKKLQEAASTIEKAATRTRAIERKLKDIQSVPVDETCGSAGEADEAEKNGMGEANGAGGSGGRTAIPEKNG